METTSNDSLTVENKTFNFFVNTSILDLIVSKINDNENILSDYNELISIPVHNIKELSKILTNQTANPFSINCGGTTTNISDVSEQFVNNFNLLELPLRSWLIAAMLMFFSFITIFGNVLVIFVVIRETYLHNVTNYFVASLAIADLIVGAFVMPFSVILEVSDGYWPFGQDFCDIWRSTDVLASTSSILNLCVISLDRYWAITDSMSYPRKMSNKRAAMFIAAVWICSSVISFPAIIWWRAVAEFPPVEYQCTFTNDSAYLIVSSMISFYSPLLTMSITYCKIFIAASELKRSLKVGSRQVHSNGECPFVTLRIHRGGMLSPKGSPNKENGDPVEPEVQPLNNTNKHMKNFNLSRKIFKFGKECKAAKTLGIVMGVFILCWLPFFVMNVLTGICGNRCIQNEKLLSSVFTWLGWANSGMNPIIYGLWSRDFRRAFTNVLCSFCPKSMRQRITHRIRFRTAMKENTSTNQTKSTKEENITSTEDINL